MNETQGVYNNNQPLDSISIEVEPPPPPTREQLERKTALLEQTSRLFKHEKYYWTLQNIEIKYNISDRRCETPMEECLCDQTGMHDIVKGAYPAEGIPLAINALLKEWELIKNSLTHGNTSVSELVLLEKNIDKLDAALEILYNPSHSIYFQGTDIKSDYSLPKFKDRSNRTYEFASSKDQKSYIDEEITRILSNNEHKIDPLFERQLQKLKVYQMWHERGDIEQGILPTDAVGSLIDSTKADITHLRKAIAEKK